MSRTLFQAERLPGYFMLAGLLGLAGWLLVNIFSSLLGPQPPGVGQLAPRFEAAMLNGDTLRAADYQGRVLLVDFFLKDCVGCIGATPKLNRLHSRYKKHGFAVLSLSQDSDEIDGVKDFVKRRRVNYPVALDEGDISDAFGVASFPTEVLVDREGRIRAIHRGGTSETKLKKQIERLLID